MKPQKITGKPQLRMDQSRLDTKQRARFFLHDESLIDCQAPVTVHKYWISFPISALLSPKFRYERHFTEKRS